MVCEALHVERITFNKTFINENLKQAERLFWLAIIPELPGKWFTRDHIKLLAVDYDDVVLTEDDDGRWSFRKTPKGCLMIGCEDPSCVTKWLHMSCLRMKNCPKNKWFCPNCYALRSVKKSHKVYERANYVYELFKCQFVDAGLEETLP